MVYIASMLCKTAINRTVFFLVGVIVSAGMIGCSGFKELVGKDYPESAYLNYNAGIEYLGKENYEVSGEYFQFVKSKYAFSKYATQSELLIAETYYRREMFAEAIDAFKSFQRNHPNNPCLLYSQYRIAESCFEQMPEDWWFMPPAFERDQADTERALKAYRRAILMERAGDYYYPPDFKAEKIMVCEGRDHGQVKSILFRSRKQMDFCMHRLVDREVFVAEFNLRNDSPVGSVLRLEAVFRKYPEISSDLELVRLLARSYEEAEMFKKAKATWLWIAREYPDSDEAEDVKKEVLRVAVDEKRWLAERKKKAASKARDKEEEKAWRDEHGLQMVDPDPNPNADDKIPLPKSKNE